VSRHCTALAMSSALFILKEERIITMLAFEDHFEDVR
jgi:hypothetical protein